jgi:hypothetical protein
MRETTTGSMHFPAKRLERRIPGAASRTSSVRASFSRISDETARAKGRKQRMRAIVMGSSQNDRSPASG